MTTEDIRAIIIGLITTGIGNFIAYAIKEARKQKNDNEKEEYKKSYVKKVKAEFYISTAITILLTLLPRTNYEFVRTTIKVLTIMSLSFSVMAFMCMNEIADKRNDGLTDGTAEKKEERTMKKQE